jgi:hypothetical protein
LTRLGGASSASVELVRHADERHRLLTGWHWCDSCRYELVEPQEQEGTGRRDGTPPPLPARQNYQAKSNSCTPKKDKESHYATGKSYDNARHHNNLHNHEMKESNYVSPRAIQESIRHDNYQRLENAHRNQEHVSTSYVKLQKEKYETKQENIYASQRELHKNEGSLKKKKKK